MTFGLGYSLLMAVKVTAFFTFIYLFIPAQIIRFRDEESLLDRIFISLTHATIITIVIVHTLSFLKLYETFSLLLAYLVWYIVYSWVRGRSPMAVADALGMKLVANILDMSEGRTGLTGELVSRIKNWFSQWKAGTALTIRKTLVNPFAGLFPLALMASAAVIRFSHSIAHSYFGASDSYVHLAWVKYLGANQIYRDGIYSYGYHAVLSALGKLTLLDPYFILRFAGPVAGILLVLSVYHFSIKNFKGPYAALVALIIYGIITDDRFPSEVWRQTAALPQEYSAIFLLPGIHFFNLYIKSSAQRYLWLSAECLAITILIHPYVTVFLSLSYVVMFLCYPGKVLDLRFFTRTASAFALSFLLGVLPGIIGVLTGKRFHSTLGYIKQDLQSSGQAVPAHALTGVFEDNPFMIMLLISCFFVFLYWAVNVLERKDKDGENKIYLVFSLVTLALYALYRAGSTGLLVIMDPNRIATFMAVFAAITYAAAVNTFDLIRINTVLNAVKGAVTVAVFAVILLFTPVKIPEGSCFEYDEAANAYLKIKSSYPALSWTIVAPVEQYQQTLGFAWHVELLEFVRKMTAAQQQDGAKSYSIPTDYIFIFTEKIPLGSERPIQIGDLDKKIPEPSGDATEFYYRNVENRTILQAKAYFWAEDYMKKNSNMEVFFEGQHLKVFMIKQDYKNPLKLF